MYILYTYTNFSFICVLYWFSTFCLQVTRNSTICTHNYFTVSWSSFFCEYCLQLASFTSFHTCIHACMFFYEMIPALFCHFSYKYLFLLFVIYLLIVGTCGNYFSFVDAYSRFKYSYLGKQITGEDRATSQIGYK